MTPKENLSRRHFLRQSFAFSALAGLGYLPAPAATRASATTASHLMMVGDWGYEDFTAQARVASSMQSYVKGNGIHPEALLMLGDNWYGPLPGGAKDQRWKTQFEDMYPKSVFDCKAYAIPGNHDYQRMPQSKVAAELEYARTGGTRWTMPSLWYSFDFPAKKPMVTVIALDSNMPSPDGARSERSELHPHPAAAVRPVEVAYRRARKTPLHTVPYRHGTSSLSFRMALTAIIPSWSATGSRCCASIRPISISPDTIMTCSISSSMGTPRPSSSQAEAEPTSTISRSNRRGEAPWPRRSTASANSKSRLSF